MVSPIEATAPTAGWRNLALRKFLPKESSQGMEHSELPPGIRHFERALWRLAPKHGACIGATSEESGSGGEASWHHAKRPSHVKRMLEHSRMLPQIGRNPVSCADWRRPKLTINAGRRCARLICEQPSCRLVSRRVERRCHATANADPSLGWEAQFLPCADDHRFLTP